MGGTVLWWAYRWWTDSKIKKLLLFCPYDETVGAWICLRVHIQVGKSTLQIVRNLPWKREASPCHQGFHLFTEEKYQKKIANKWAEMRQPPSTVERAFKLACDIEKQLQVADSFKLEFSSYPAVEVTEMSTEECSGDELEISRGKKWGNNNNYNQKHSNFRNSHNYGNRPQQNKS